MSREEQEVICDLVERIKKDWVCSNALVNSAYDPDSYDVYSVLTNNYANLQKLEFNVQIKFLNGLHCLCEHNLAIVLKYFLLFYLKNIKEVKRGGILWQLLCFFSSDGGYEMVKEPINKKIIKDIFDLTFNYETIYGQLSEVEIDMLLDCIDLINKSSFKG